MNMLIFFAILLVAAGMGIAAWTTWRLHRGSAFGDVLEGVRFGGCAVSALSSVVVYGILSGQIVLPLW